MTVPALARRLGVFDATMIVMGGIIGAGIFRNPSEVARHASSPSMMIAAWVAGGVIALAGAFVYAELAQRRPEVGGQYAYIRDAFHPMAAFLYGWVLLLVIQTGGMAAVAMTFADYVRTLAGWDIDRRLLAIGTLLALTGINCLGVRSGSNVQNTLMVMKIAAILMLLLLGLRAVNGANFAPAAGGGGGGNNFLAAMVPVLFAYGGWQTASFVSGEMRNPERDLPRGLLIGVLGVIVLYTAVSLLCVLVLGPTRLAATATPASDVMGIAIGDLGAQLMAGGIAISTVGFLSQGMLTAPRVYYAMAKDGVFFERIVGDRAVLRRVRARAQLRRGARCHLLRADGRRAAGVSPPRSRARRGRRHAGASDLDGRLRARVLDARREHDRPVPERRGDGGADPPAWRSRLSLLAPGRSGARCPAVEAQRHAVSVEAHAFPLEQKSLRDAAGERLQADASRGVDDPLPGDRRRGCEREERVSDLTRVPRVAGEPGDLTVGRDASTRDAPNDDVELSIAGGCPGRSRACHSERYHA
jgi:APA family basic amino acid/polyamine antiporter